MYPCFEYKATQVARLYIDDNWKFGTALRLGELITINVMNMSNFMASAIVETMIVVITFLHL